MCKSTEYLEKGTTTLKIYIHLKLSLTQLSQLSQVVWCFGVSWGYLFVFFDMFLCKFFNFFGPTTLRGSIPSWLLLYLLVSLFFYDFSYVLHSCLIVYFSIGWGWEGSRILADVYISLYISVHFFILLCVFAYFCMLLCIFLNFFV